MNIEYLRDASHQTIQTTKIARDGNKYRSQGENKIKLNNRKFETQLDGLV